LKDSFPLPLQADLFDAIGAKKTQIFSTLDMTSGFWHIGLSEEAKQLSAFITADGLYDAFITADGL